MWVEVLSREKLDFLTGKWSTWVNVQLQHRSFPVTAILFFLKFEASMVIKLLNQWFHFLILFVIRHVDASTRSGSDLQSARKGACGATAAKRASWSGPDAPHCHSRSFSKHPAKCDTSTGLYQVFWPWTPLLRCADPRCSLCPAGWSWWRSHCYFFSLGLQENRPWNESAEFCQQHDSSLVVIKDSAEMVTLMLLSMETASRGASEVSKAWSSELFKKLNLQLLNRFLSSQRVWGSLHLRRML